MDTEQDTAMENLREKRKQIERWRKTTSIFAVAVICSFPIFLISAWILIYSPVNTHVDWVHLTLFALIFSPVVTYTLYSNASQRLSYLRMDEQTLLREVYSSATRAHAHEESE